MVPPYTFIYSSPSQQIHFVCAKKAKRREVTVSQNITVFIHTISNAAPPSPLGPLKPFSGVSRRSKNGFAGVNGAERLSQVIVMQQSYFVPSFRNTAGDECCSLSVLFAEDSLCLSNSFTRRQSKRDCLKCATNLLLEVFCITASEQTCKNTRKKIIFRVDKMKQSKSYKLTSVVCA